MNEKITPFGRGEQIGIEKTADALESNVEELKDLVEIVLERKAALTTAYQSEMAKPEWARSAEHIEKIQKSLEELQSDIDKLDELAGTFRSIAQGAVARYEELEERKEKEGY